MHFSTIEARMMNFWSMLGLVFLLKTEFAKIALCPFLRFVPIANYIWSKIVNDMYPNLAVLFLSFYFVDLNKKCTKNSLVHFFIH